MKRFIKKNLFYVYIIAILFLSFLIGNYLLINKVILPRFSALEKKEDTKLLASIKDAIIGETISLSHIAMDWAAWDDMYEYVQHPNKKFEKSNFQWESLKPSRIDLIYVCSNSKKLIWGGIFDPDKGKNISLPTFSPKICKKNKIFQFIHSKNKTTGIIITKAGPMFLSILPILKSNNQGPSPGFLIMGRFFNKKILSELQSQLHIKFQIKVISNKNLSFSQKNYIFKPINKNLMKGYTYLKDLYGKPSILIAADFSRDIMNEGMVTARLISLNIFILFAVISIFVISWFVFFKIEYAKRQKKIKKLVRKKTKQLEEAENNLRTLINATPDIICFKDGEGRWLEANEADLKLFGLTNIDYKGKKDSDLAEYTHPIYKNAFLTCEDSDNKTWQKRTLTRFEEKIPLPDGTEKIYDIIKVPVFNEDGSKKGLIVFGRDITQERILLDKLYKAKKMEAIGLMLGGVAHDINNILSGIINYPELLLLKLPKDSVLRKYVEKIKLAGENASKIVSDLLTIARGIAVNKEISNLNILVKEYINSPEFQKLKEQHPNIKFKTQLDKELLNFKCSPVHIKKVIMNLVTNAAEAIQERDGKVIIETKNFYIDKPVPINKYSEPGEYVLLTVKDNGEGISEEDMERIFEPFYTKKKMEKSGTGLGLAIVWNTVNDHKGWIDVKSSNGWTTFKLYFPATRANLKSIENKMELEKLKGNGEKIIVIDDEKEQQEIAYNILSYLGYNVKTFSSGEEALNYLTNNKADLVILDMILSTGKLNGRETYEKIIKKHSKQKAIIVSGFSEDEEIKKALELGVAKYIKKPYLLNSIAKAVKEVLEKS